MRCEALFFASQNARELSLEKSLRYRPWSIVVFQTKPSREISGYVGLMHGVLSVTNEKIPSELRLIRQDDFAFVENKKLSLNPANTRGDCDGFESNEFSPRLCLRQTTATIVRHGFAMERTAPLSFHWAYFWAGSTFTVL